MCGRTSPSACSYQCRRHHISTDPVACRQGEMKGTTLDRACSAKTNSSAIPIAPTKSKWSRPGMLRHPAQAAACMCVNHSANDRVSTQSSRWIVPSRTLRSYISEGATSTLVENRERRHGTHRVARRTTLREARDHMNGSKKKGRNSTPTSRPLPTHPPCRSCWSCRKLQ